MVRKLTWIGLFLLTTACGDIVVPGGETPGEDTKAPTQTECNADSDCNPASCQNASCDTDAGVCVFSIKSGQCFIDSKCFASGESPDDDQCQECDPDSSLTDFSGVVCADDQQCSSSAGCIDKPSTGCEADADCDDSNACTVDTCNNGTCETAAKECASGSDPCFTESCDAESGECVAAANAGAECDDGVACTGQDVCDDAGACAGSPDDSQCDDGDWCNGPETCTSGDGANDAGCTAGQAPEAPVDDEPLDCLVAACDSEEQAYEWVPAPLNTPCDDQVDCTTNDLCGAEDAACAGTPDDTLCTDSDVCNGTEFCQPENGGCVSIDPPDCNDQNDCTEDSCDSVDGCSSANVTGDCNDDNACTEEDTCVDGTCTGADLTCNDESVCTSDTCLDGECVFTPIDGGVLTCADYAGQCGSTLSDGCSGTLDCSTHCGGGQNCINGSCQAEGLCSACQDSSTCGTGQKCLFYGDAVEGDSGICTPGDCADDSECPAGWSCNTEFNYCWTEYQSTCTDGTAQLVNTCGKVAVEQPCAGGSGCNGDYCETPADDCAPCQTSGYCGADKSCTGWASLPDLYFCLTDTLCSEDTDCPSGQYCLSSGKCFPEATKSCEGDVLTLTNTCGIILSETNCVQAWSDFAPTNGFDPTCTYGACEWEEDVLAYECNGKMTTPGTACDGANQAYCGVNNGSPAIFAGTCSEEATCQMTATNCAPTEICNAALQTCVDNSGCEPNCDGVTCGTADGCNGTCGCNDGYACNSQNFCEMESSTGCGDITYEGCCVEDVDKSGNPITKVVYCSNPDPNLGEVMEVACSAAMPCSWSTDSSYYLCGTGSLTPPPEHPYWCGGGNAGAGCESAADCEGQEGEVCLGGYCVTLSCGNSCTMVELTATADSWLEEEAGGLGSQKELRIGKTSTYPMKRSLIRFSLAGKLPKGITIAGAELSVYQFGATAPTGTVEPNLDREIQVFRVNRSWTETGVTWMTTGTQEEWTEPYLGLNGEDADVTPQDTKLWMYADYGYKTFSLTALVQAWYAEPESNFGVLLRATNEQESGKDIQIRSREYGGNQAQRPTLRIFYQTKIIDPNNPTD